MGQCGTDCRRVVATNDGGDLTQLRVVCHRCLYPLGHLLRVAYVGFKGVRSVDSQICNVNTQF